MTYELFINKFVVIGGPCAIESYDQLHQTISAIHDKIDIIRAGAFKPRTSPNSFQGLGEEGLIILAKVSKEFSLPTVTEVMDTRDVELVAQYADIIQIGARNMQNFALLKEVSKINKTIVLKRGLSATVDEWLKAAEYLMAKGNKKIVLCERGIRTFETSTRFTFDLAGALIAKEKSGLPVISDPSHATGNKKLIAPLTFASKAAGLNGVMIEVHNNPTAALCDAEQALTPTEFLEITNKLID